MKKTIAILLLFCLLSVFAVSCSKSENWVPAGMKKVEDDAVDYTLFVPDDWEVTNVSGYISARASDYSNVSVTAFNLESKESNMTPEEYWNRYAQDLRTTFGDFRYLGFDDDKQPADDAAGTKIALGGTHAMKYQVSATVTGIEYHYTFVCCSRGGYMYLITYTALPDNYETHTEEFEKILTNFSFEK